MNSGESPLSRLNNGDLCASLVEEISRRLNRPVRIMEVCGSHTMAIFRHGLRALLPQGLTLVSGPGCPVCVTSPGQIDSFIELARRPDVILTTFGDLYRVPGSGGSLTQAAAQGAAIKIVYSPMEALTLARKQADKMVVFAGIGFETTTPTVAATIMAAAREDVNNFTVLSAHKLMPPALKALFQEDLTVDGLLCPGHVSAIIGTRPYEPLTAEFHLPCVVAGFEAEDILQALLMLVRQNEKGKAVVENAYSRVVNPEGNPQALSIMNQVFSPEDCQWRGLGQIPVSGLRIRPQYDKFNAAVRFGIKIKDIAEPPGCLCGEVLKGMTSPSLCPLFAKRCTPMRPVGPCMVSSEGTCAAFYKFQP
ncbi:[NiFe] hydrogenase metallocenter assembly protein HypD [hydrothermal vent metagenome]|uniref:[NiFe] hydrogenase metallocenter assembly protein HypD n=1 Tax=hydrothermal vent metagenome TaxID=652676 RepID=A0A3B0VU23_9ZZZZ